MPTTLAPADSSASNRVLDNALRALTDPRDYVALSAGVHAWQQLGATNDVSGTYDYSGKRVILLPDGTEDFWSNDYRDLIELA